VLFESGNGGSLVFANLNTFWYDAQGNSTLDSTFTWDSGTWKVNSRTTRTFNGQQKV
jgi:hypothetical protein